MRTAVSQDNFEEYSWDTFHITWYPGRYWVIQAGRCRLLCGINHERVKVVHCARVTTVIFAHISGITVHEPVSEVGLLKWLFSPSDLHWFQLSCTVRSVPLLEVVWMFILSSTLYLFSLLILRSISRVCDEHLRLALLMCVIVWQRSCQCWRALEVPTCGSMTQMHHLCSARFSRFAMQRGMHYRGVAWSSSK